MTVQEQQKHTMARCQQCCNEHQVLQQSFPLRPCYLEKPLVVVNAQKLEKLGKKEGTRTALAELNESCSGTFQRNFVDSLVAHGGERLQVILSPPPSLTLSLLSLEQGLHTNAPCTYAYIHVAIVSQCTLHMCIQLQVKPTRAEQKKS